MANGLSIPHSKEERPKGNVGLIPHSAFRIPHSPFDAIHRSLLTGLLANCACLDKNGKYKAAGGKEVLIFPGSALIKSKCEWIMCHEVVETSRVFARTVAGIKPEWLEELAADFCKHTFESPFFDAETGYVRATERVTVFGMPLAVRKNALYCRAEPEHAAEIFIREGLIEENLVNCRHKFYAHNKNIKKKVLTLEDKLRARGYYGGDDVIFDFYREKLGNAASIHDLNNAIKAAGGDRFLFMNEEDILSAAIPPDAENFPDHVNIGNRNFALKYAFEPGADHDGVTLALPQKVLPFVEKESLEWLLPALWPDRIKNLLQQLPRGQRKMFIPMNEAAERLAAELGNTHDTNRAVASPAPTEIVPSFAGAGFTPARTAAPTASAGACHANNGTSFAAALSLAVKKIYGIDINPALLESKKTDSHLDLKIEVRDGENKIIAKGRSADVFNQINGISGDKNSPAGQTDSPWDSAFASYRKTGLVKWPDENLSEPMTIASPVKGGIAVKGYPALIPNDDPAAASVDLVLFPSKTKSDAAHRGGVRILLELALGKDLAWTERELSFSNHTKILCSPFGSADEFTAKLYGMICNAALDFADAPRNEADFNKLAAKAKESMRGISFRAVTTFEESLKMFTENISRLSSTNKKLPPDIAKELEDGLNGYFKDILDGKITLDIFLQYPRYLKVFSSMIEKAACEPLKYRQKRADVNQYITLYIDLRKKSAPEENRHIRQHLLNELAQMIREYEVNLFAQQIKTLFPVSQKRLDKKIEEIKQYK